MDRRALLRQVLVTCPAYALLAALAGTRGPAGPDAAARRWILDQQDLALALARGEIHPRRWQAEVEALLRRVDLATLSAEIGRAEARHVGRALPNYPVKHSLVFRDEAGVSRRLRYATALFRFDRGNVITPHGHRHMVSAHLVIEGAFRVRTFDRLRDEAGAMILRPSGDAAVGTGEVSTMSAARDNVHWFVPRAARAATFDVIVSGLDPGAPAFRIEAVDPVRGERLSDGSLRAPIIDFVEASRFYTAEV